MDDQKSLSIAFLTISDQYSTLIFWILFLTKWTTAPNFGWLKITLDRFPRNFRSIRYFIFFIFFTKWTPAAIFGWPKINFHFSEFFSTKWLFLMTENHFQSHFSPFHINTQLKFFWIFFTKCPPAAILDNRNSLSIVFLAISYRYATFFFYKMATGRHFGWQKITFDCISCHFISICNFNFLGDFFLQNGHRRPFWMTENHRWSYFSPFHINTQLLFFLIFFYKMATGGHFGWPKITLDCISPIPAAILDARFLPKLMGTSLYSRSVAKWNMKLMGVFLIKLCSAQDFSSYFHKMLAAILVFSDYLQNR